DFEDGFVFSGRGRHTGSYGDWSADVCSSDLMNGDRASSHARAVWCGVAPWADAIRDRARPPGAAWAIGAHGMKASRSVSHTSSRSEERRVGEERGAQVRPASEVTLDGVRGDL